MLGEKSGSIEFGPKVETGTRSWHDVSIQAPKREAGEARTVSRADPNIESKIKVMKWLLAIETGLMKPWLVELVYPDRVHEGELALKGG